MTEGDTFSRKQAATISKKKSNICDIPIFSATTILKKNQTGDIPIFCS